MSLKCTNRRAQRQFHLAATWRYPLEQYLAPGSDRSAGQSWFPRRQPTKTIPTEFVNAHPGPLETSFAMMLPSLLGKQFSLQFSCVRLVWFLRASVGLQIDDCFSFTKGFRSARCREF